MKVFMIRDPIGLEDFYTVLGNYGKKYWLKDVVDKENHQRLLANPCIYNIWDLAIRLNLKRFKMG